MKALKKENTSSKLFGEVHLARIRLAKAESQLATDKEQARLARRRRKEAKLAARRAKKQARLSKKELAEAKLILAQAEDNLARLNQRPLKIKPRKKPAKQVAAPRGGKLVKKAGGARAVGKPARVVAVRSRASVKLTAPQSRNQNGARPVPGRSGSAAERSLENQDVSVSACALRAGTARAPKSSRPARILTYSSAKPAARPAKASPQVSLKRKHAVRSIPVLRDLENPGVIASAPVGKPTDQIVTGVDEILAADKQTEAALALATQPLPGEHSSIPNQTVI